MHAPKDDSAAIADDVETLHRLGYAQELLRRMSGFSNYAVSLSIICILAGGITSFHLGFCSVGGASIGLAWPLVSLFALVVAATMGQIASAFPTAGGLYHWASILGGRGWGWATAWFNLAGLITVLAAINVGTFQFAAGALATIFGFELPPAGSVAAIVAQTVGVSVITFSHAIFNHLGIRLTTLLTDFSGYLILVVAAALTIVLLVLASGHDLSRLVTFTNYSGVPVGPEGNPLIWPKTDNIAWLFALGFLLPAYTITGFDASAHTAEETVKAAVHVPQGMVRSVLVSGVFGWVMLIAMVLAIPNMDDAAARGDGVFHWLMSGVVLARHRVVGVLLYVGIALAQYLCGLATVTSASRMAYAFARDGGLPWSQYVRSVHPNFRTPVVAIWFISIAAVLFTIYTPVYSTITIVAAIFLYISYVVPISLGFLAHGGTWTRMGPWQLGRWYRPLAVVCVIGCGVLIAVGMAPPNDKAIWIVGGSVAVLVVVWLGFERKRFRGPPVNQMPNDQVPNDQGMTKLE